MLVLDLFLDLYYSWKRWLDRKPPSPDYVSTSTLHRIRHHTNL